MAWQSWIKWKKWALLSKIEVSRIVDFCHFKKISQLLQCISCSILIIWNVLGHFGKVLKSSNQCLWSHVSLIYQSQVMVFDLKCLFVDFWKWPIMLKLITFCESISWTWNVKMSCRKCHSIQNEHWMGFFWWTMKKLCLGQVTVDFSAVQK